MDIQQIIAYTLVIIAVFFLIRTFFYKKKRKKGCGNDETNCKCG
ncbi:conserved hypothetical protein [Capnocytophaga canis]|uniref:FeoB-associated Cys-rich membrane protein n=1 Tax=Capnocytophaga canis TaxID=1848903 RepID=A0A3A1YDE6_9FLAO|nr:MULTISPECIES: FeoB-associated Cys-rich membrane protein [Capnocytophaga]ATA73607.1 FeoB-associated Cys-rich membrane protein [Capnocytophaga sp. H4358]ATA75749.1 FeoB-associated Cys-rich membrane protein [Capnocytophaga sp. H2931]RIY35269.1 FeoB-associated Cys-rich membrane protein [Capnocytophaga canis]CEN42639.1 conserved hypothetical protein [Capnocytophaga canis]